MSLLNRFTIRQKIILLVAIFVMTLLLNVGLSLLGFEKVRTNIHSITEVDVKMTKLATHLTEHQLQQEIAFEQAYRSMLMLPSEKSALVEGKTALLHFGEFGVLAEDNIAELHDFAKAESTDPHLSASMQEKMKAYTASLEVISEHHKEWQAHSLEQLHLMADGKFHQAALRNKSITKEAQNLEHEVVDLLEQIEHVTEVHIAEIEALETELEKQLLFTVLVSLIVIFSLAFATLRSLHSTVKSALDAIKAFAKGDLRGKLQVASKDEIALIVEQLAKMQQGLVRVVGNIGGANNNLISTTENLTDVIKVTDSSVTQQTNDTRDVSHSLDEIGVAAKEVSSLSASTLDHANEAKTIVVETNTSMEQAISKFHTVNTTIKNTEVLVKKLEQDSASIVSVLDVIKAIAEQTNLLALNAAIEAARAGEQGRGFAVVADEVRTLAQRTQDSTGQIEEMLNNFKGISVQVSASINECVEHANSGVDAGQQTLTRIQSLVGTVDEVHDRNQQIASAAEEQSSILDQIATSIKRIEDMAANNNSSVNDITQLTVSLTAATEMLNEALAEFNT